MGILDSLRKVLTGGLSGKGSAGGGSRFGEQEGDAYWVHARCSRCGEPLRSRINLNNDPSLAEDGQTWIVRKGLIGSGKNYCFQTVDVTLRFDLSKRKVVESEVSGGSLITAEEYAALADSQA